MRYSHTPEYINDRIKEYSKLTVTDLPTLQSVGSGRKVTCKCICGNTTVVAVGDLLKPKERATKSCGCLVGKLSIEQINAKIHKFENSRLTAIEFTAPRHDKRGYEIRMCRCLCKCGNYKEIKVSSLMAGEIRSCNCLNVILNTKYNHNGNWRIYNSWKAMMDRCTNPKCKRYNGYGGKGVMVCDEWRNNYQNFYDWSILNGWEKGLQIDKDILGDGMLYSPSTCKWVSQNENAMYTSKSRIVEYNGSQVNFRVICNILGINGKDYTTIYARIKRGWSAKDAIEMPIVRR